MVYLLLFLGGYFLDKWIVRSYPAKPLIPEVVVYMPAPTLPHIDAANALRTKYIDGLGFHGDLLPGQKSKYLTTKEEIINAYNA